MAARSAGPGTHGAASRVRGGGRRPRVQEPRTPGPHRAAGRGRWSAGDEEEGKEEEVRPRPRKQAALPGGGRNQTPNCHPAPEFGRPRPRDPPRAWDAGPAAARAGSRRPGASGACTPAPPALTWARPAAGPAAKAEGASLRWARGARRARALGC